MVALVALLATAYAHPPEWVEAVVAITAAGAVLATGTLTAADLGTERRHLLPVVGFLVAILVVAECCRAAGLFAAIGERLARAGSPQAMFALVFAVAAVITVVLSLDATVVLLTPVVLAATAAHGWSDRPFQLVCVRLANVASLLLPISNLTNLLALPDLDLSFGRFALLMAPVWVLALAVEYAGHRVRFRRQLAAPPAPTTAPARPLPRFPLVVVGLMLAGFAVGSEIDPFWVAGAAALVLAVRGLSLGELGPGRVWSATHAPFALFVLALGLVVAALGEGPLGDLLDEVLPHEDGLLALLGIAAVGLVLSNVVNNLPATLLLVPLVAPLGPVPVLASLIGINLGSSMTWSGSLANLLWRRTVARSGGRVSSRDFHLLGLALTPLSVAGGVVVLHLWSAMV
ncbi:arsenic transporter [Nocardioides marmoriginsengisoli]|uniref:Arsenic transporter n=2 Tax=Nocardioides marmoriginsengisoli TaxID=661483 RepID=A0A3N0CD31_9ACTN|nr:arsenic transporter [Nocardioides marmoriginsengisoli]